MSRRLVSRASRTPRTYFMMAALCHSETRRFANDNGWSPLGGAA